MKICVFIRELTIGGAEKQSLYLCKALQDKNDVFYVVLHDQYIEKKYLDFIDDHEIKATFLKGNLFQKIFRFASFLKTNRIQVIFSYLFSTNLIGAISGKLAGVPHIIGGVRNSTIVRSKLQLSKCLHNHLLEYSIFNSYSGKENLSKFGLNPEKSIVIPNCFDFQLPPIKRNSVSRIELLTVARFMPQKDYETAIKSLAFLLKKYSDVAIDISYTIVGYGKEESNIRNMIKSMQLEKNVSVIVKPDNLNFYYEKADIYLSTSLYEGLSNSIMEAMHYSLPIVATNVGDNNQLVCENINGYICQMRDYVSIADRLSQLIKDPTIRIAFGEASYRILKNNYSIEKFRQQYINLLEKL